MADQRFRIIVEAVNKTTSVLNAVNRSFQGLARPVTETTKAAKSLVKESGLQKVGAMFKSISESAGEAASKIAGVSTPMAAITSYGSVAGMTALAVEWARFGSEIPRTAQTIGVAAQSLQTLRGAGKLAGVDVGSLTSGLQALGTTLEDALYGRNMQAVALMSKLGIAIHRTASGAVDSKQAFYDLADAIARNKDNPQVQALIARNFGLEESLPLLRQGSAAIKEFEEQWKRTGAVMSAEDQAKADKFRTSIVLLGGAFVGLANAVALDLSKFQPVVEWITKMISGHTSLAAHIVEVTSAMLALRTVGVPLLTLFRALALTPIGAAMTAIAVAGYLIYKNWDAIIDRIHKVGALLPGILRVIALGGGAIFPGSVVAQAAAAGLAGATVGASPAPVVTGAPAATPYTGLPSSTGAHAAAGGMSMPSDDANASGGMSMPSADGDQDKLVIEFMNAPHGMRVRSSTGHNSGIQTKINYAMPGLSSP